MREAIRDRVRRAMADNLPYGRYVLADGSTVLFNRNYKPIHDRERWVPWVRQEWFYYDGNPPWANKETLIRCLEILGGREPVEADLTSHKKRVQEAEQAWRD